MLRSSALQRRFPGATWDAVEWAQAGRARADGPAVLPFVAWGARRGPPPARGAPNLAGRTQSVLRRAQAPWPAEARLPACAGDLLKAYYVLARHGLAPGSLQVDHVALRVLWHYLEVRAAAWTPATAPAAEMAAEPVTESATWLAITDQLLGDFEQHLIATPTGRPRKGQDKRGGYAINQYVGLAVRFGQWLYARGLVTRPIRYVPVTPDAPSSRDASVAAREADAEAKLPPPGMVEAVADLYFAMTRGTTAVAPTPLDLTFISLIALLLLTGRRVGEAVTLPADCERWQRLRPATNGLAPVGPVASEQPATLAAGETLEYGIAYYVQKTRTREERIYWVPASVAEVVQECVARLRALSASAWARAAELEASPDMVPLPAPYADRAELSTKDICDLVGIATVKIPESLRRAGLMPLPARGFQLSPTYPAAAVRAALQTLRPPLYSRRWADGHTLPLSATLAVRHAYASQRLRTPSPVFVEMVSTGMLRDRLGGRPDGTRVQSLFAVYGTAEQVALATTHSHAFRHWLTSVAFEGGADVHALTEIFGRANPRHTPAYVHALDERRAPVAARPRDGYDASAYDALGDELQDGIRMGRYFGPVALTYWSKVAAAGREAADAWLAERCRTGHRTPWGMCSRDLATHVCEKHLACLDDCEHYHITVGDAREMAALDEQASWQRYAILQGEAMEARGERLPLGYLARARKLLSRLEYALAVHRGEVAVPGPAASSVSLVSLQRRARPVPDAPTA